MEPTARQGIPRPRRRTPVARIAALALTALLASACSPGRPPSASPVVTTPAATTGTADPQPQVPRIPTGTVARDKGAELRVSPVDYDGVAQVAARFAVQAPGRPVSLQRSEGSGWVEVADGELDEDGTVQFLPPFVAESVRYRAVAGEYSWDGKPLPPVATPTASARSSWNRRLSSDFSGTTLPSPWEYSITGSYLAGGRQCSAPYPSNVAFDDGTLVLSVTKETNAAHIRRAEVAGCTKGRYFRNALLTTGSRFTMRTGMVAARVKFPQGQGMHGAVFVLSPTLRSEIDVIESYGYGKGLTSVSHLDGTRYPTEESETFVLTEAVKDRSWWSEYHVYSVQWSRHEAVFFIDGVESARLSRKDFADTYSVFISLLSSDWELDRMENPRRWAEGVTETTLPQYMHVDWVKAWTPRD